MGGSWPPLSLTTPPALLRVIPRPGSAFRTCLTKCPNHLSLLLFYTTSHLNSSITLLLRESRARLQRKLLQPLKSAFLCFWSLHSVCSYWWGWGNWLTSNGEPCPLIQPSLHHNRPLQCLLDCRCDTSPSISSSILPPLLNMIFRYLNFCTWYRTSLQTQRRYSTLFWLRATTSGLEVLILIPTAVQCKEVLPF